MFPKFFADSPFRQSVGDGVAQVRVRSVRTDVVKAHCCCSRVSASSQRLRRAAEARGELFVCFSDPRFACRCVYCVQAVHMEGDSRAGVALFKLVLDCMQQGGKLPGIIRMPIGSHVPLRGR